MKEETMKRSGLALLALALLPVFAMAASAEDTVKVVTAQKGAWPTSMTDYGMREGFFKAEGLDISLFYTDGGAPTVQAIISGSSDVAIDTGILGILGAYTKGGPVRVISANSTGASDLFWYARAGTGITSFKDAAIKTAGFSENGSSSNLVLLGLLAQAGSKAKPIPAGGMPATLTQVLSGQIDAGWAAAPFALKEVTDGKLTIIAHGNDVPAFRDETVRVNVANADALKTKRDAIARFMRAYGKTVDWAYSDPKAIDYFAAGLNLPRDLAAKAIKDFYPRQMMQLSEIKGLDLVLKQAIDNKYVPATTNAADIAPAIDLIKPN
jgi:NitT/TauT family transport system substrate-binding protein